MDETTLLCVFRSQHIAFVVSRAIVLLYDFHATFDRGVKVRLVLLATKCLTHIQVSRLRFPYENNERCALIWACVWALSLAMLGAFADECVPTTVEALAVRESDMDVVGVLGVA